MIFTPSTLSTPEKTAAIVARMKAAGWSARAEIVEELASLRERLLVIHTRTAREVDETAAVLTAMHIIAESVLAPHNNPQPSEV